MHGIESRDRQSTHRYDRAPKCRLAEPLVAPDSSHDRADLYWRARDPPEADLSPVIYLVQHMWPGLQFVAVLPQAARGPCLGIVLAADRETLTM